MIAAITCMGAKVERLPDSLIIEGTGGKIGPFENVIDVGNSGICLRFLAALFALSSHFSVITGDASIRHQRPMAPLMAALKTLGASVHSLKEDGFAPLIIKGPITGQKVSVTGEDSQPVSALLIACALKQGPTEIRVTHSGEHPWVALTLHWLEKFGISVENDGFHTYRLQGGAVIPPFDYTVPGDFSSAAFPLAAALITRSSLTIENLDMNDSQGDKGLIAILQKMGANIAINPELKSLQIVPGAPLKGISVNVNDLIDAVPILSVIGCYAEGETRLTGAKVARDKECDRLSACTQELRKMGGKIEESPDELCIQKAPLNGASLFSHHDHRMAMALSVAAMGASGLTEISPVSCVEKTFPTFLSDMKRLGACMDG